MTVITDTEIQVVAAVSVSGGDTRARVKVNVDYSIRDQG